MNRLERQLEEDRALRDSARALFRKELEHVRGEVKPDALGERLGDNIGRRVDAASDEAIAFAERHGGKVTAAAGALAAGVGLWLARKPILARLSRLLGSPPFIAGEGGLPDKSGSEKAPDEDSTHE